MSCTAILRHRFENFKPFTVFTIPFWKKCWDHQHQKTSKIQNHSGLGSQTRTAGKDVIKRLNCPEITGRRHGQGREGDLPRPEQWHDALVPVQVENLKPLIKIPFGYPKYLICVIIRNQAWLNAPSPLTKLRWRLLSFARGRVPI